MKINKIIEITLEKEDILSIADLYQFAISEGYIFSRKDKELIKAILELDYVKENNSSFSFLHNYAKTDIL